MPRSLAARSPRLAISLIEILVVIAILAVLMGLLIPAVNRVRGSAMNSQCRNSLRQMGLALTLHAQNNAERYMKSSTSPTQYWFGLITDSSSTPQKIDPSKGLLSPYLEGNRAIVQCPNFPPEKFTHRFDIPVGGYGYNDQFNHQDVAEEKIEDVTTRRGTSVVVAFADSARVPFSGPATKLEENWYLSAPSKNYPNVHFRHDGQAFVAYADGHVDAVTPTKNPKPSWETPEATTLREQEQIWDIGVDDSAF